MFFYQNIGKYLYFAYMLSTMINQIVNKVYIRIKTTPPHESHFSYLTKKRHIQTQARQDNAWHGMARQGQARPDEARRGGAQTRRCPLVLKNTVADTIGQLCKNVHGDIYAIVLFYHDGLRYPGAK